MLRSVRIVCLLLFVFSAAAAAQTAPLDQQREKQLEQQLLRAWKNKVFLVRTFFQSASSALRSADGTLQLRPPPEQETFSKILVRKIKLKPQWLEVTGYHVGTEYYMLTRTTQDVTWQNTFFIAARMQLDGATPIEDDVKQLTNALFITDPAKLKKIVPDYRPLMDGDIEDLGKGMKRVFHFKSVPGSSTAKSQTTSPSAGEVPIYKAVPGSGVAPPERIDIHAGKDTLTYLPWLTYAVVVDERGDVRELQFLGPWHCGIDAKLRNHLEHARYLPGLKDGKPVPVSGTVEFRQSPPGHLQGPSAWGASQPVPAWPAGPGAVPYTTYYILWFELAR